MEGSVAPFIYVLAFLAVVLGFQSLAGILFNAREQRQSVNRRLSMLQSGMAADDVYAALVRNTSPNLGDGRLLRLYERLAAYCSQAGLSITPIRLIALVGAGTGVLWLLAV